MHLSEKGNRQSIILSSRELACLLAFSCTDEKAQTLNGASVLLEQNSLSAYASDGKKSVRGSCKLEETFERYSWLIPRSALLLASRVLIDGQEARFPLVGKQCALNGFEVWSITTDSDVDVKLDWIEFAQPIPANLQLDLPFAAIDRDVSNKCDNELPLEVRYSAASLTALKKLALAGQTPNLTLDVHASGLLHAITDGGTTWHAVVRPVSLEVTDEEEADDDDINEGEDRNIDKDGKLELTSPERKRTRKPRAKMTDGKRGGKRGRK